MRALQRVLLAALPLSGMVVLAASCADLVGVRDLPPGVAGYSACGATAFPDRACAECVDANCCGAMKTCAADAACAAHLACRSRCGASDAACRIACTRAHPSAEAVGADVERCLRTQCSPVCVTHGVYGDPVGAACSACLDASCTTAIANCAARPECDRAASCTFACSDPACEFSCRSTIPEDFDALSFIALCPCPECGQGTTWGCVGGYSDATPTSATARYTVQLEDLASVPLDGVQVRACRDLACKDSALLGPVPTGTTDARGVATLTLGLGLTPGCLVGFNGFVDFLDPKGRILPGIHMIDRMVVDRMDLLLLIDQDTAAVLGVTGDTSQIAGAVMAAFDCTAAFAEDVAFTILPPYDKAKIVYLDGGDRTGKSGTAFVVLDAPLPSDRLDFVVERGADERVAHGGMWLRLGTASVGFAEPDSLGCPTP